MPTGSDQANNSNSQNVQNLLGQLDDLSRETKVLSEKVDEDGRETKKNLDDIEAKVDEAAARIDKGCEELDQIEAEAGDELDKLILERAEELAEE